MGWQGADPLSDDARITRWDGQVESLEVFLDGLDTLFVVERTIPEHLFQLAHRRRIRCVLAVNAEWYVPNKPWFQHADLFIARTRAAERMLQGNANGVPVAYLPCPIDLGELPFRRRSAVAKMVFSNGWGGCYDRKGWPEVRAVLERDPGCPTVRTETVG